ncbi:MAG: hypothetical protein ACI8PZ_001193 [Myxococcota bacterium]|jgi:hypothetical protein
MQRTCPACDAPATGPFCGWCGAGLGVDGALRHPDVTPGSLVVERDLTRTPWPGRSELDGTVGATTFTHTAQGVEVRAPPGRATTGLEERVRLRDAIIATSFLALKDGAVGGLVARHVRIGEATAELSLDVCPERRAVRLARRVRMSERAALEDLFPWTPTAAVQPVGVWNRLELRLRGGSLQAVVNGHVVAATHDPALGVGRCGLRATTRKGRKARAGMFGWFHVAMVAP